MIPAAVQVFVAVDSVDMRFGFDRLAAIVRERVGDNLSVQRLRFVGPSTG